jgi:predicted ribosomally synthesized peptide with SipW-like signal peptide
VGAVAGASSAWFSDTEESTGNTFTAGTIDICLDPTQGQQVETVEGTLLLKPCMTGYIKVEVTNCGDNPIEVWKHLKDVESTENGVVDAEQKWYDDYNMQNTPVPTTTPLWPQDLNMSDYILYDMWIHDGCHIENNTNQVVNDPFVFDPLLDQMIIPEDEGLTVTGPNGVECWWIYLGVLLPGETIVVIQSYHLMSEVENWAQSDVMTFTMEFLGQQAEGLDPAGEPPLPPQPGPGSNGELSGHGRADWPPYGCPECVVDADCPDDGVFCNGPEVCDNGYNATCVSDGDPCEGTAQPLCDEDNDRCVECFDDGDCPDDNWCTPEGMCEPIPPP